MMSENDNIFNMIANRKKSFHDTYKYIGNLNEGSEYPEYFYTASQQLKELYESSEPEIFMADSIEKIDEIEERIKKKIENIYEGVVLEYAKNHPADIFSEINYSKISNISLEDIYTLVWTYRKQYFRDLINKYISEYSYSITLDSQRLLCLKAAYLQSFIECSTKDRVEQCKKALRSDLRKLALSSITSRVRDNSRSALLTEKAMEIEESLNTGELPIDINEYRLESALNQNIRDQEFRSIRVEALKTIDEVCNELINRQGQCSYDDKQKQDILNRVDELLKRAKMCFAKDIILSLLDIKFEDYEADLQIINQISEHLIDPSMLYVKKKGTIYYIDHKSTYSQIKYIDMDNPEVPLILEEFSYNKNRNKRRIFDKEFIPLSEWIEGSFYKPSEKSLGGNYRVFRNDAWESEIHLQSDGTLKLNGYNLINGVEDSIVLESLKDKDFTYSMLLYQQQKRLEHGFEKTREEKKM